MTGRIGSVTYAITDDGPHKGHQAKASGEVRVLEPTGDGGYALEIAIDVIECLNCDELFAIEPGKGSISATIRAPT